MSADSAAPRVLSLLSASTEIVFRLGCGHLLVGRSHGCDDPPLATAVQIATAPKVDPNAGSREIDRAVRIQVDAGGPVYHIYDEVVAKSKPTVILTQEQCRICAVTKDDVHAACTGLPALTRIVTIKPVTLDDVLGDVVLIAEALGVEKRGERLANHLRSRLSLVSETAETLSSKSEFADGRPKVVHLEWLAPLMGSGYWIAECVEAAGCTMIHGTRGGHAPVLEFVSALEGADLILIAPCGFSIERTHAELHSDALRPAFLDSAQWHNLPAVRAGRVYVADGNKYFNRSSCGVAETAEIVAECAWESELCGLWGHHGKRWVRMSELDAFCGREGAPPPTKRVVVRPDPHATANGNLPTRQAPSVEEADAAGAVAPVGSATAHVQEQIQSMREEDFSRAFSLNSNANQARLGDSKTFEAIVRGHSSFAALAASPQRPTDECEVQVGLSRQTALEGLTHELHVWLLTKEGRERGDPPLAFAFQLTSEPCGDGSWKWRTEGVRVVC